MKFLFPPLERKLSDLALIINETSKTYHEFIDLSGSREHDLSKPRRFLISDLKADLLFNSRHSSLLKESTIRPHIQRFSYLDFYPLFLRRSEAEEKLKT